MAETKELDFTVLDRINPEVERSLPTTWRRILSALRKLKEKVEGGE